MEQLIEEVRAEYLELLKRTLTHSLWQEKTRLIDPGQMPSSFKRTIAKLLVGALKPFSLGLARLITPDPSLREKGEDWPELAHTMIGLQRLSNIQQCVEDILRDNVPGDLIETGVWRGGATIFMRAILKAYGVKDRKVWVADSFEGLPPPSVDVPADKGDILHQVSFNAVSLEKVKSNFEKYRLLDSQVEFLKGWFKDTLPKAPIRNLALMRLDGDMYQSTKDALVNLYPKLSPGGYVIIDDYAWEACRQAVADFQKKEGIREEITMVDNNGAYWRRAWIS